MTVADSGRKTTNMRSRPECCTENDQVTKVRKPGITRSRKNNSRLSFSCHSYDRWFFGFWDIKKLSPKRIGGEIMLRQFTLAGILGMAVGLLLTGNALAQE